MESLPTAFCEPCNGYDTQPACPVESGVTARAWYTSPMW